MNEALPIITTIVAFVSSILGFSVLFRNRLRRSFVFFFIATQAGAIWILANTFFPIVEQDLAVVLGRISFSSATILQLMMWLFAIFFPQEKLTRRKYLVILISLMIGINVLLSWTDLYILGINPAQKAVSLEYGSLYPLFAMVNVLMIILVGIEFYRKYKSSNGLFRLQISYFATGYFITSLIAFFTNLIIPLTTGNSFYSRFGPMSTIIFFAATTFAVLRLRLFGVKYILSRVINGLVIVLVPFASFYGALSLQNFLWGDIYSERAYMFGILISIVFAYTYSISRKLVAQYFAGKFVFANFDPEKLITEYARAISTELDIRKISGTLLAILTENIQCNKAGVVIFDGDQTKPAYVDYDNLEINSEDLARLLLKLNQVWSLQKNHNLITRSELAEQIIVEGNNEVTELKELMDKYEIEIVMPLNKRVELTGILLIGNQSHNDAYTSEELDLLENLAINTSAAFSRAVLHYRVQDLSENLQKKVSEATGELQQKYAELEEAYRKEKDMMDILAHELRTPLSTSRNAFLMLETSIKSATSNDEKINNYIRIVKENLQREIKLLETMLSTTKLDNKALQLQITEVNIAEVCETVFANYQSEVTKKGLIFNKEVSPTPITVKADKDRLLEIIDNLATNAIKYTTAGYITIKTISGDGFNGISIEDTGEGIPTEDLPNLGKKFYRVNQHIDNTKDAFQTFTRPGGTGLGLYVAFGLAKLMGGNIQVTSAVGKGSTFTVWLPN